MPVTITLLLCAQPNIEFNVRERAGASQGYDGGGITDSRTSALVQTSRRRLERQGIAEIKKNIAVRDFTLNNAWASSSILVL
jgi:hypothetical protein